MSWRPSASLILVPVVLAFSSLDAMPWGLEVRGGAVRWTDSLPQQLYGTWAPEAELEAHLQLRPWTAAWLNLNGAWTSGDSLGLGMPTRLGLYTGSLGLKFMPPSDRWAIQPYLGAGLSIGLACTCDESLTLPAHTSKWSVGGVLKSGLLYSISSHFFSDLFLDYYYQPISTSESSVNSSVDVGGLRLGLGIGVHF